MKTPETSAIEWANNLFPEARISGSPFQVAINERVAMLRETDPDFFQHPTWPIEVASQVARERGVTPSEFPAWVPPGAPDPMDEALPGEDGYAEERPLSPQTIYQRKPKPQHGR